MLGKSFLEESNDLFWDGFEAYVASPEDVIIKKLWYFREGESEKHLYDIRGIIAHQKIDREYLKEWIQKLALVECWDKV